MTSFLSNLSGRLHGKVIARNAVTKQSVASLRAKGHPRIASSARSLLAMTIVGTLLLPRPARALEFPKYEKVTRGNTTVIAMKQDRVPLVAIRVTLDFKGIVSQPEFSYARAAVYLHSVKYGSAHYPGEKWLQAFEATGGELREEIAPFAITLATEVRSEDAEKAIDLLTDGLFTPELKPEFWEKERARLTADARSVGDQPQALASQALDIAYFGADHPYGEPDLGTPASLEKLTSHDVTEYFQGCLVSSANLFITIVGDYKLSAEQLIQFGSSHRVHLTGREGYSCRAYLPGQGSTRTPSLTKPRVILIDVPDATQTQVRLMVPGPTDLYSPLHLANVPFGGTFTSRLTRKLRTELGLTYGIYSHLEQRPLASTYEVSSFTKVASTGEFLKVLFAEFAKARAGGLTAEEIAKGKALMLGEGPMRWERYSGLAALLERNTLDGRPDDYPLAIITRAQGVDAKAANAALAAALPNKNYVLVLAGPAAKIRTIAAQYGAVEVWTKQQVIDPKP